MLEGQICTVEHGANTVGNGAMWAFGQANGAGSVGRSDIDFIASLLEQLMNAGIATKFAAAVKANAAASNVGLVVGNK